MNAARLKGVSRRESLQTTTPDKRIRSASDLADRNFTADRPNRRWVADNTYAPTWAGFLYLSVALDAFFGAATEVTPKFLSPAAPAARWTVVHGGQAFFACSTSDPIDLDHAVIVNVEASTAVCQAERTAAKAMIERAQKRLDLYSERLAANTAFGSAEMLGWLVHECGIEPHVPVFDKSKRRYGTISREDSTFDVERDL